MTASHPDLRLTDAEWAAVSLALRDAGDHGCAAASPAARAGPVERLAALLFGRRRPTALADPRLEAIRRFACSARRSGRPADEQARELAAHGFTAAQIDAIALLSR